MYKNYFNIEDLKDEDYKEFHVVVEKKYFLIELYSNAEINNLEVKPREIRHDVMSYGENNCVGRFITNYNSIKYLALNETQNKIKRTHFGKDIYNTYNYYQSVCFVENKTKYYKLNFDFDYKYDKHPEIYENYTNSHTFLTKYIVDIIIQVLDSTIKLTPNQLKYVWAENTNTFGHHLYWPEIIVNRELHQYIFSKTLEIIINEKKISYQIN